MRMPKHKQAPLDNPKVQVIGPSLLESLNMVVEHEFDCVKLTVGGHTLTMEYPTAFTLSELLRCHGKQAKKFAGDGSLNLGGSAVLTDAEENYKRGF